MGPRPRANPGEVVLIVDDNESLRKVVSLQLRSVGYTVLEADDGPAVFDALEKAPRIDVLLTDVLLPGELDGPELASRAKERRSELRVLLMSGLDEDAIGRHGEADRRFPLLSKPFRLAELTARLREVLDRR